MDRAVPGKPNKATCKGLTRNRICTVINGAVFQNRTGLHTGKAACKILVRRSDVVLQSINMTVYDFCVDISCRDQFVHLYDTAKEDRDQVAQAQSGNHIQNVGEQCCHTAQCLGQTIILGFSLDIAHKAACIVIGTLNSDTTCKFAVLNHRIANDTPSQCAGCQCRRVLFSGIQNIR